MTSVAVKSPGLLWRTLTRAAAPLWRKPRRRILIAGIPEAVALVRQAVSSEARGVCEVFVSKVTDSHGTAQAERLAAEALRLRADETLLCWPDASPREILSIVGFLADSGLSTSVIARSLSGAARRLYRRNGRLAGYPRVRFGARRRVAAGVAKRTADLAGVVLMLPFLIPLWMLVACLLLVFQGRPVILKQERVGRMGRRFAMYKFRTMLRKSQWPARDSLEALNTRSGPMYKAPNDPRVTFLGKWLRRLCIDETPQFVNVLKGDMSLVGARPPLPEEVERYEYWQLERLCGHVGITGLWQTSNRSKLDFEDVVLLDFHYSRKCGLLVDLKILAATVTAIVLGRVTS